MEGHDMAWKQTGTPGIRYREHSTRKHGVKRDRYFAIYYKVDGKRREQGLGWASEGWNLSKALEELGKLKEAARTGEGPVTLKERRKIADKARRKAERQDTTLAAFWEEHYAPAASQTKKPETWRTEEHHFRIWLAPRFGSLPLREIDPRELDTLRNAMRQAGRSPRTVQHVLATFRAVWKMACDWDIVAGDSPSKAVKVGHIDNARVRFLSPEELAALLAEVKRRDPNAWELVLAAANTGARLGELASLTWGNVNLMGREINLVHTKTGKPRTVPMTPNLADMLRDKEQGHPGDLVFQNSLGGPWGLQPTAFRKAVATLGLNRGREDRRERIVFHSLRHTAASLMLKAGVDLRTIQSLFGWSTLAMLQRYTHAGNEAKLRAVERLAAEMKPSSGGKVLPMKHTRSA
ncbi:MAG: tyrosine-type recombinase/integrase [Desulfovibrionaceae bacterium]